MRDEFIDLLERAGIEQQLDPLVRGELAGFVLASEAVVAAPEFRTALEVFKVCDWIHAGRRV
jgi:hypothetical protein